MNKGNIIKLRAGRIQPIKNHTPTKRKVVRLWHQAYFFLTQKYLSQIRRNIFARLRN